MKFTILSAFSNTKLWFAAVLLQLQPLSTFINKYLFSDLEFLKWLMLVVAIDLITGIAKVVKHDGWKAVTSKGLRDTVSKLIQYGGLLIITHILTHYQIEGQAQMTNILWVNKLAYEFVILIEIKSVYENITAINSKFDFFETIVKKVIEFLPKKYKQDELDKK